jgi:hypothetical protein
VITRDHGVQEVLWTGRRRAMAVEGFAPVSIAAGAMGNDRPVMVSQQHRVLVEGWQAEMLFGAGEVLVPAVHLLGQPGVTCRPGGTVSYHHLLLRGHAVLCSAGLWTESFHAGRCAIDALLPDAQAEIVSLHPDCLDAPLAYPSLRRHEASLLWQRAA